MKKMVWYEVVEMSVEQEIFFKELLVLKDCMRIFGLKPSTGEAYVSCEFLSREFFPAPGVDFYQHGVFGIFLPLELIKKDERDFYSGLDLRCREGRDYRDYCEDMFNFLDSMASDVRDRHLHGKFRKRIQRLWRGAVKADFGRAKAG